VDLAVRKVLRTAPSLSQLLELELTVMPSITTLRGYYLLVDELREMRATEPELLPVEDAALQMAVLTRINEFERVRGLPEQAMPPKGEDSLLNTRRYYPRFER